MKTLFNSRGIRDLNIAAAGFQGYTANRQTQWFKLIGKGEFSKVHAIQLWLEACEERLVAEFNATNFYEALGEFNPDLHAIGTAILYSEEDPKRGRMVYQTRHPLACWIAENSFGEVDTVAEEVYMTLKAAKERFPDTLPDNYKEQLEKDPYAYITLRHIVAPYNEKWHEGKPIDKRMSFSSLWYDPKEKKVLDTGGYWEFPFAVGRYAKNAGEVYGRGPGHFALGDILGANQMARSRIRLGQLVADPTLIVPEELRGEDQASPGGRIYKPRGSDKPEPLQIGANYPITIDNETRQDDIIDYHFNVQIYMMLQQAQGQMTAREVSERMGEKAAVLGYVTGRYTNEVLQPLIKRTFNAMLRAGRLPPPPDEMKYTQGGSLDIDFLGFMAQIQRRYYQTNGVNASLEYIGAMGQMFPQSLDNVDSDKLLREAMESVGGPASILRDEKEVQQIRQLKAQEAQRQQQQQEQMAIMQNMDKLGKKPEDGSPIMNMGEALAAQQGTL